MAKQLIAPSSASSKAVTRYSGRSDEPSPTFTLSGHMMQLAENMFNAGRYSSLAHFSELVKGYLNLPPDQHDRLMKNLQLEPFLRRLESDKRLKSAFALRCDLGDSPRNLRIVQRPVLAVISEVDEALSEVKYLGLTGGSHLR